MVKCRELCFIDVECSAVVNKRLCGIAVFTEHILVYGDRQNSMLCAELLCIGEQLNLQTFL